MLVLVPVFVPVPVLVREVEIYETVTFAPIVGAASLVVTLAPVVAAVVASDTGNYSAERRNYWRGMDRY